MGTDRKPSLSARDAAPAGPGDVLERGGGGSSTALVPVEARAVELRDGVLVVTEHELSRRIRRRVLSRSLLALALILSALIIVGISVRDRVRGPERLSDLHFPAFGELARGTTSYLNPGDINATEKNAAWRI